jgi:glycosyltransferase involved in cell wall biosynthesis
MYAINNFRKYGDIIVMDGGSTDKTQEICEKFGIGFYRRPSKPVKPETTENFEFIKSKIKTDWVYWGFVDNIAPLSLITKMVEISRQDKIKMVSIPLHTYLWGDTSHVALKSYVPFFFHKDFADLSDPHLHSMAKFTGRPEQFLTLPDKEENALRHFSTYNISRFVSVHMHYGEVEANDKFREGQKFSVGAMLRGMVGYGWIFKRNFKNGALGLIIIFSYIFYRLMHYARLYELEKGITLELIESNYGAAKEELLKEFK